MRVKKILSSKIDYALRCVSLWERFKVGKDTIWLYRPNKPNNILNDNNETNILNEK